MAFAVARGQAGFVELAGLLGLAASPLVIGTGLLHLCGIAFGMLTRSRPGTLAVRGAGGVIAALGAGFLTGAL